MRWYRVIVTDDIGSGLTRANVHEVYAPMETQAIYAALSEYEQSRHEMGPSAILKNLGWIRP